EAVCKLVYLNYKLSDAMQIQITQSIRNNASLLAINKYLMFQINFKTNSKIPDEADYWLHSARLVTDAVIALADADGPDLVSRLDMHLLQTATSVRDVLADPDDAVLLERVRGLGACFFCRLDGKDDGAKLAAGRIVRTPESFAPLVRWLAAALAAEPAYNCWYPRTEALLRVTADAAARLPDAFLKVATPLRLNALLTTAARSSGKYGRRAAVRLLGYLRSATVEVIETILATLKDDDPLVQAAALEVTREFCEVAPSAIRRLTAALVDDSGVVALGAARILTALSRQQWLDPGARTDILHALATALADRRSHRYVVLLTCTEPLQIQPIGRLDQAFHTALLVATGVLDAVS
ncbi:MAG TPA: HEAT repeat domain-containing protein, partial [Urbifossiella sp.]|nr:HEAT repeat domain-containing protein [Urbifossiella sp.]